jgi:hypothetical protein
MRKLKWFMSFLFLAGFAHSTDLEWKIGDLKLTVPLQKLEAVSLYDIIGKKGYAGAESVFASYRTLQASAGIVTDADLDGTFFLGGRRQVPAGFFKDSFYIGLWIGRDFRESVWRGGVKASIKLWDVAETKGITQ